MRIIEKIGCTIQRAAMLPALLLCTVTAGAQADSLGYTGHRLTQYYYTEGIKKAKIEGDRETALGLFDMAIANDPAHSASYYEAATTLLPTDPVRALQYSDKAVELDSTNVWYSSQQAHLFISTGHYEKARRAYERLISMAPKIPENYAMLALLYQQTGQPYAAIAVLDKAENTIGKIEQLAKYKTELLVGAGLMDRAIEEAEGLVAAYPYNYEGYMGLAQLYAEARKDSLATANYNMALALNPDGLDIIASMNEYYRIKNDATNYLATAKKLIRSPELSVDTKIQIIKDVTQNRNFYRENYFYIRDLTSTLYVQYPDNYQVLTLHTNSIRDWGDFDEATSFHKEYIKTPRSDLQPYMDVISMEAYKQRPDSVKKYTELALERFPTDPELYVRLGGTYSWLGEPKQAVRSYEKALKYAEGDSVKSIIHGVLGDEYHKQGDDKKSFRNYDTALQLWGDNTVVLNNYAYYLSEKEINLDKALRMAQRVMALEPANSTYIDTYGWVLFKLGLHEEAKKAIRQAIAADTDNNSELLLHYGDILSALGEDYMATVYWKRALDAGHDKGQIEERLAKAGGKD